MIVRAMEGLGGPRPRAIRRVSRRACGLVLIEVLISAVIVAIGVLGLARLQGRAAIAEMESQQRTHALLLARDMADRLVANKPNAGAYVGSDYGSGSLTGCVDGTAAGRDRCAWDAALRGNGERLGAASVGTLRDGRGCIARSGTGRYQVVVTWQGLVQTVAPANDCGRDRYGPEAYRRAIVLPLQLPDLEAS